MRVDRGGLAGLDVACLGLGDFQLRHQAVRLHNLGEHRPRQHVLSDLQGQVHQNASDLGANFQSIKLFLFQLRQNSHLVDLGL